MKNASKRCLIYLSLVIFCGAIIFPTINGFEQKMDIAGFSRSSLNDPPVVDFSWSPLYPTQFSPVTFDASSSFDPDGGDVEYWWDLDDDLGPDSDDMITIYRFGYKEGTHRISLSVRDDEGQISSIHKYIRVVYSIPVANFIWTPENPIINNEVILDASSSFDPDGDYLVYSWDYDADPLWDTIGSDEDKQVKFTWDEEGEYIVTLQVMDIDGHTDTVEKTITVSLNQPPVVEITSPVEDSLVVGNVNIKGLASDPNDNLELIEIKIDNGNWLSAYGTLSWNFNWDSTQVDDGSHKIFARSYDGEYYSEIDYVEVIIDNIFPVIRINSITAGVGSISSNIENIGLGDAFDVYWRITVNGGLFNLIEIENFGTIENIKPNEDISISTYEDIFGFGPINVLIFIESDETGSITMNKECFIVGPFIIFQ